MGAGGEFDRQSRNGSGTARLILSFGILRRISFIRSPMLGVGSFCPAFSSAAMLSLEPRLRVGNIGRKEVRFHGFLGGWTVGTDSDTQCLHEEHSGDR
jgi:hypothetical protein